MEELHKLRKEIDSIDNSILQLLLKRAEVADNIFSYKEINQLPITDMNREEEIISSLKSNYKGQLSGILIESILNSIFRFEKIKHNYKKERTLQEILNDKPILIAGPCAVESEEQIFRISKQVADRGIKLLRGGAFKPRTSPRTFQGLGNKGIEYIRKAANELNMYVVSEIMDEKSLDNHYDKLDIIQIGSRNMTATGFLKEVAKATAKDKKPVLLKRGFSSTIKEFLYAAEYIASENENILLCLRGIRTYEQIDSELRFTPDLASIIELRSMTKLPVLFDPSHAAGVSKFVMPLAKAALILDADGLMIECHDKPDEAEVDSEQAIHPSLLSEITGI